MQGELAALSAAFIWALASVIFGRVGKYVSPLILNGTKGLMALGLIALTLGIRQQAGLGLNSVTLTLLVTSGAIGIGLGDTAYFAALNHLGPRRALLLETLAPPLAALIAWGVLQEQLTASTWAGISLTLGGVGWVISERVPAWPGAEAGDTEGRDRFRLGIFYGILAALGQAMGAVLSRAALAETAVDPLWSTLLRLIGGLSILGIMVRWQGPLEARLAPLRSLRLLGWVAIAAFFGTYIGIWLQQVALKYAPTGIAQALTATSPLFILPIAAWMGDRVTWRACGGVLVALAGIWILVMYR